MKKSFFFFPLLLFLHIRDSYPHSSWLFLSLEALCMHLCSLFESLATMWLVLVKTHNLSKLAACASDVKTTNWLHITIGSNLQINNVHCSGYMIDLNKTMVVSADIKKKLQRNLSQIYSKHSILARNVRKLHCYRY